MKRKHDARGEISTVTVKRETKKQLDMLRAQWDTTHNDVVIRLLNSYYDEKEESRGGEALE